MPQVIVEINGRNYTLQCGEGQEAHIRRLARMIDDEVSKIRDVSGPLGDVRLLIMASLVIADRLVEAEQGAEALRKELAALREECESGEAAKRVRGVLEEASGRLERLLASPEAA